MCVNIDNHRECPGACMQFFSVSNVQVYSLPPVALRRLRGLVESGACEQWRNVAGDGGAQTLVIMYWQTGLINTPASLQSVTCTQPLTHRQTGKIIAQQV